MQTTVFIMPLMRHSGKGCRGLTYLKTLTASQWFIVAIAVGQKRGMKTNLSSSIDYHSSILVVIF